MHPSIAAIHLIIPARNVAPYIRDLFASLKGQPEVGHVVVVDDHSEDSTCEEALKRGGASLDLFRLREHHNQYFAKNVGLREVLAWERPAGYHKRAEYVAFLDADDFAYSDRFKRQWDAMEDDPDIWAVGGACHNVSEDGSSDSPDECVAWPLEKDPMLKGMRQYGIGLWNATALYRREVFDWLGSFDYTPGMGDTEWFIRLVWASALAGKKLINIQQPIIHRRIRENQVSHGPSNVGSPWRVAYEALLKQKFAFFKTLHHLNQLTKHHIYRANEVLPEDYRRVEK